MKLNELYDMYKGEIRTFLVTFLVVFSIFCGLFLFGYFIYLAATKSILWIIAAFAVCATAAGILNTWDVHG